MHSAASSLKLARRRSDHPDHGYDLGRAGTLASTLNTKFQQDSGAQETMGWMLVKQGNLKQALPLHRSATAGKPDNPAYRYHLGATLLKSGQTAAGRKELEAALKLSGEFAGSVKARTLLGRKG